MNAEPEADAISLRMFVDSLRACSDPTKRRAADVIERLLNSFSDGANENERLKRLHTDAFHEAERWKDRYQEEYAIVDRVWKALGIAGYEEAGGEHIDDLVRARVSYAEEVKRFADGMADAAGLYTLEGCIAAYRKFLAEHGRTTNAMAGAHILAEAERHETGTKPELVCDQCGNTASLRRGDEDDACGRWGCGGKLRHQSGKNMTEPLYRAAINCRHEIDTDKVVLYFNPDKPGHNALNQLAGRLEEACVHQVCNDDTARMDFLSRGSAFTDHREEDLLRSDTPLGKAVLFSYDGVRYFAKGETLREAVDAAMKRDAELRHVAGKKS